MTNPNEPSDAEIQASLDAFLEKLPDEVPTCLYIRDQWITVNMGQSIEDGSPMVVVEIAPPYTGTRTMYLAFDEDSAAKLITLVHEAGTHIWGIEEGDSDDHIG